MANFLTSSESGVAQSDAETESMVDSNRRKNAAYNALTQTYGPQAGDPEAWQASIAADTAQQEAPLKLQEAQGAAQRDQLNTDQTKLNYDKQQALTVLGVVKNMTDNGVTPDQALQHVHDHLQELGVDEAHYAPLAQAIHNDPEGTYGKLYDALQNQGGAKPVGSQIMLQDAAGADRVGYLGGDGKLHIPGLPPGMKVKPKVSGAGVVVDNGDGTQSIVKTDATGASVAAALPGKTVQSEQNDQKVALEKAKVRLMAERETRIAATGGVGALSPQTVDYLADQFRTTGKLPAMGQGGAALRAQVFQRAAEKAAAAGAGGQSDAYTAQATKERGTAVNDLGRNTPTSAGGKITAVNTAVNHLDQLSELGVALTSGNLPAINAAQQAYMKATGLPAPTNFNAVKKIAADEVAKAIIPGAGGVSDRKQTDAMFSGAQSPQQLQGTIQQVQHLLAGQVGGVRQRYQAIGALNEFDATLAPRTKQVLGLGQQPGSQGWSVVGVH